jgi:hypothetical protein
MLVIFCGLICGQKAISVGVLDAEEEVEVVVGVEDAMVFAFTLL